MTREEMAAWTTALHSAVEAFCPIFGVSVGRWDDRKTWSIQFCPEATAEQKAAGEKVLAELDLTKVTTPPTAEEKIAALEADVTALKAAKEK